MTRRPTVAPAACLLAVAVIVWQPGCGLVGAGPVTVTGKVTMDGTPLADGRIAFLSTGDAPPVTAEVKDGHYSVDVPPGERRVEISSPKVVGQKPVYEGETDGPVEDVVVERVAAKFNTDSKFSVEIGPDSTTHDFAVESATTR